MSYNIDYNRDIKENIRNDQLIFNLHVFERQEYRQLNLIKIKETIEKGRIKIDKSEEPNKLCFQHYFGKENETYIVITLLRKDFIEVKTAWTRKGR